jgi:hypothetical protein
MSRKYYLDFEHLVGDVPRKDWTIDAFTLTLRRELPEVIRLRSTLNQQDLPPTRWDPATHVVLLTDGSSNGNATATTCTEYITKTWSTWFEVLLKLLDDFTTVILNDSNHDGELVTVTKRHSGLA